MAKKTVNVALIGTKFMGKAHSNGLRQVARFFDMPVEPTLIDEIRKATRGGYPLGVQRKSRGRPPSERKIGTVPI